MSTVIRDWWKENRTRHGSVKASRQLLSLLWEFSRDSTPARRRQRYGDVDYDWDHRVDTTSATVGWRDRLLGLFLSPYQPTEPALFHQILGQLRIDFEGFVFVDLGSGKGRTLLMAADYPFLRVVGVEILPELHRVAEENIRAYKSESQNCFAVESECADARDFAFPREPLVLYLFNPLPEAGLTQVIAQLEASLRQNPRAAFVVYHNPQLEEVLVSAWLQKIAGTNQYSIYAAPQLTTKASVDPVVG